MSYQVALPHSSKQASVGKHASYLEIFLYMYVIFLSAQGHQVLIPITEMKICDTESAL